MIDDSDLEVLNKQIPTRVLAISSSHRASLWQAHCFYLPSVYKRSTLVVGLPDYLSITVSVSRGITKISAVHHTYINFKKANGSKFLTFTEHELNKLDEINDVIKIAIFATSNEEPYKISQLVASLKSKPLIQSRNSTERHLAHKHP